MADIQTGAPKSPVLTTFSVIYGIIFLFLGIAGFIPALSQNGLLFGYFNVDAIRNVAHLIVGIIFLWVAGTVRAAHNFFRLVGIVAVIIALLGFWRGEQSIFDVIANNQAISWLSLVLGIVALILGFCTCCKKCTKC